MADMNKYMEDLTNWGRKLKSLFKPGTGLDDPLSQGLLTMGLSMLSAPPRIEPYGDFELLGKGGLAGMQAYNAAKKPETDMFNMLFKMYPDLMKLGQGDQKLTETARHNLAMEGKPIGVPSGGLYSMETGTMLAPGKAGSTIKNLAPGGQLFDTATGKVIAENPKDEKDPATEFATFRAGMPKKEGETDAQWNARVSKAHNDMLDKRAEKGRAVFQTMPTSTPGVYVKRGMDGKMEYHEVGDDGQDRKLTSREVENRNLAYKEATPTARTKTMEQLAPKVLERAETLKKKILKQGNKLGPVGSRARNIWAQKIGASDPEFTSLQADADLAATLLANMHVGASGAEKTIERFAEMLNVKNQSPKNLLANVEAIIKYANAAKNPSIKVMPRLGGTEEVPQSDNKANTWDTYKKQLGL